LVSGDDIEERRGEPGGPVPDGDDRGPLTPMAESEGGRSQKRLAGESVDSGSSSVIGTSSHSIEPHSDDDETERRVFSRRR